MENTALQTPNAMSLEVLDPQNVRKDLALVNPADIQLDESKLDKTTIATAETLISQVKAFDPMNPAHVDLKVNARTAIETMGEKTQRQAAEAANSPMLKKSIALLAKTDDGGPVAQSLIQLNNQVLELDPSGIDFTKPGGIKRLIGSIFGSRVQAYFSRYEKADAIINQIVQSLINGRGELSRDNAMLLDSQKRMRAITIQLEKVIMLGMYIDQKLDTLITMELSDDDPRKKFIGEELVFPLKQRILDLQQQLGVNQQGVLVYELIMRNNRELIKGVQRAELVTVTALNIAVAAALALGNQKLVLTTLNKVNETTNNIIAGTAARLKTQAADIHKQASSAMLDINTLKKAFGDVKDTLEDISTYRMNALAGMRKNIAQMHELNLIASQAITKMEEGNQMAPAIMLDVSEVQAA